MDRVAGPLVLQVPLQHRRQPLLATQLGFKGGQGPALPHGAGLAGGRPRLDTASSPPASSGSTPAFSSPWRATGSSLRMADVVVINKVDNADPAVVAAANVAAVNPTATVIRTESPVRPYAVGSITATFRAYPSIGLVLPAIGYSQRQIQELRATIDASDCDMVVAGTPIDLRRIVGTSRPVRQARYELRELGHPDLADMLAPILAAARSQRPVGATG